MERRGEENERGDARRAPEVPPGARPAKVSSRRRRQSTLFDAPPGSPAVAGGGGGGGRRGGAGRAEAAAGPFIESAGSAPWTVNKAHMSMATNAWRLKAENTGLRQTVQQQRHEISCISLVRTPQFPFIHSAPPTPSTHARSPPPHTHTGAQGEEGAAVQHGGHAGRGAEEERRAAGEAGAARYPCSCPPAAVRARRVCVDWPRRY